MALRGVSSGAQVIHGLPEFSRPAVLPDFLPEKIWIQLAASRGGDLPVLKLAPGRDVGVAGQHAVRAADSAASRPPVAGRGAVPASAGERALPELPDTPSRQHVSRMVISAGPLLAGAGLVVRRIHCLDPFSSSTRTGTPRRHEPIDETTAIPAILSAVKGVFAQAAGG
jgi:hypothetical protein